MPNINENNEQLPDSKVTKEDVGIPNVNFENSSRGGTDFGSILSQCFEDIERSNPDMPKHVFITSDLENGDILQSNTISTYNEEEKKKLFKNIEGTEFKEIRGSVGYKKDTLVKDLFSEQSEIKEKNSIKTDEKIHPLPYINEEKDRRKEAIEVLRNTPLIQFDSKRSDAISKVIKQREKLLETEQPTKLKND